MEDISRRMEFRDRVIKRQGVDKLVEAVITKHRPTGIINEATTETAELSLLFEKCGDSDVLVCNTACNGLLSLLQRTHIDSAFLLRRIINQCAVARSLSGIISLVTTILTSHIDSTNDSKASYACPFSIHERPHPYITVLKTQPSCWRILLGHIQHQLSTCSLPASARVIELFRPFIKYVLVDPSAGQISPLKVMLISALLGTVSTSGECFRNIATLLLDCAEMMQMDTSQGVDEAAYLLDTLGHYLLLTHSPDVASGVMQNIIHSPDATERVIQSSHNGVVAVYIEQGLSIIQPILHMGSDPSELLRLIFNVASRFQQDIPHEMIIAHCADLLGLVPDSCLPICLQLASLALKCGHTDAVKIGDSKQSGTDQTSKVTNAPNRILTSLLALPTLQILASTSESSACQNNQSITSNLARTVMASIEQFYNVKTEDQLKEEYEVDEAGIQDISSSLSISTYRLKPFIRLTRVFSTHRTGSQASIRWLNNLTTSLTKENAGVSVTVPNLLVCMVSGLLIDADSAESAKTCLQTLQAVCSRDTVQSVRMLPLLLYKLKRATDCRVRLELLHFLPRLATDRMSIAPILSFIHLSSCSPALKPLSLRLLTQLWQADDRCFPHLMRLINQSAAGTTGATTEKAGEAGQLELLLARAASICDVCCLRPSQHGEDMLAPLSDILNQCTRSEQTAAVCLALQGLTALCLAEVIDLRTAWLVLAPKLSQDKRPLVLVSMCRMLSLAADMEVETEEYQTFLTDVLDMLWTLTRHSDVRVVSDAYLSLSHFPRQLHSSHHLIPQDTELPPTGAAVNQKTGVTAVGKAAAVNAARPGNKTAAADDDSTEEEDVIITGDKFVNLIKDVNETALNACTTLLQSLIKEELESLPRGVKSGDKIGREQDSELGGGIQNRAVASLPTFIHEQHENNRDPAIRSGLALSRLLTYDPSITTTSRARYHPGSRGKVFHQSLQSLINEVTLDPADWYQCQVKGQAWLSFMDRCFQAYVDMRLTELKQAITKESSSESIEENRILQDGAWLWARDKLADLIKGQSRGSPGVQCNSVYAMCALASVVHHHASRLDEASLKSASALTEHVGQNYWLKMISETVLNILDHTYQPTGRFIGLCGRKNTSNPDEMLSASVQARAGAAAGLAMLAVPLAATSFNIVQTGLDLLCASLPGVAMDTVPDVVQMHAGIGLGGVISALVMDGCIETLVSEEAESVWRAAKALEASAFSASDNRMGSISGLCACLTSLCRDGKVRSSSEVVRVLDQLISRLRDQFLAQDPNSEALAVGVASISGAAYQANIIPPTRIEDVMALLQKLNEPVIWNVGVSRAVGVLLYVLQSSNHRSARDLIRCQFNQWAAATSSQECSTNEKLAAVCGMLSLAGAHRVISPTVTADCGGALLNDLGVLNDVTRLLKSTISSTTVDSKLRNSCLWQAGLFYLSMAQAEDIRVTVPINYHYLPETSLLRAAVDLLTDISKSEGDQLDSKRVHAILKCLNTKQALPPLNWSALLSPILRQSHGVDVELACTDIVIQRSAHTPTAARFLTTLVTPPLYFTLQNETKLKIVRELAAYVKSLPLSALTSLTERILSPVFSTAATSTPSSLVISSSTLEARGTVETTDSIGSNLIDEIGSLNVSVDAIGGNIRVYQREALIGLRDALASSGTLSEVMRGCLWKLLDQVYTYLSSHGSILSNCNEDASALEGLMTLLCDCLALVPDTIVDGIISLPPHGGGGGQEVLQLEGSSPMQKDTKLHTTDGSSTAVLCELYIRCGLIGRGAQPLPWISKTVEDLVSNNIKSELHGQCLYHLMCSLVTAQTLGASALTNHAMLLDWFTQLLGYSRSIISTLRTQSKPDSASIQSSRMVALIIFSVIICSSNLLSSSLILSLQCISKYTASTSSSDEARGCTVAPPDEDSSGIHLSRDCRFQLLEQQIYSLTPGSTCRLLSVEPWKQVTGKIIDWLLMTQEAFSSISALQYTHSTVLASLYGLRHTDVFKKSTVWSRVAIISPR